MNDSPSLEQSYLNGEISTVPLLKSLEAQYSTKSSLTKYLYLLFNVYAVISTGASFLVMSAGLKDYIDGFSETMLEKLSYGKKRTFFNLLSFLTVFVVIVMFPHVFDFLIDRVIMPLMGIQSLLLLFMYWNAKNVHSESKFSTADRNYNSIDELEHRKEGSNHTSAVGFSRFTESMLFSISTIVLFWTVLLGGLNSFIE